MLQPPINACFGLLVKLRICKKRVRRYDIGAANSSGPTISISLPGVDNHDTERRRQIALKALKDRLSKTEQSSEVTKWPSLDDDTSTAPTINAPIHQTSSATVESPTETPTVVQDVSIEVEGDDKEPLLK